MLTLDPATVVVEGAQTLLCSTEAAQALRFDGDSAELVAAALDLLEAGATPEQLRAELSRLAAQEVDPALIEQLLSALRAARVVLQGQAITPHVAASLEDARVVLAVCGAIAAADAHRTVLALQARGALVRVALSATARRFVSREVLQALTHEPVASRLRSLDARAPAPHIELGRWADAVLVAPASATTIARIARGDCSDLVSALVVASGAPVLIAPSMNDQMLQAAATRRNLRVLKGDGHFLLRTGPGVEVADRPGARREHRGGALPSAVLARAFDVWFNHVVVPARWPGRGLDWDEVYRRAGSASELPWCAFGLDEAVRRAALEHAAPPRRALDIGCGLGASARELAQLGYRVVAIDVSAVAVERAAAADLAGEVTFVRDDITAPALAGRYDLLVDRGTFHGLSPRQRVSYAQSVARLAAPEAVLVVVHDGPQADPRFATTRLGAEQLSEALPGFSLVSQGPATLRDAEPGAAVCAVFRRAAGIPS